VLPKLASVGAYVGAFVGAFVGASVGDVVRSCVLFVGADVGTSLGAAVGGVGADVGTAVGNPEGGIMTLSTPSITRRPMPSTSSRKVYIPVKFTSISPVHLTARELLALLSGSKRLRLLYPVEELG
jgi:hypothetical protein